MTYKPQQSRYGVRDANPYPERIKEFHPLEEEYLVRFIKDVEEEQFKRNIPDKRLEFFTGPWGDPWGYTIRNSGKAWLDHRLNETPNLKEEVMLHELDHCESELNTRYNSRWRCQRQSRRQIENKIQNREVKENKKNDYLNYSNHQDPQYQCSQ